MRRIVWAVFVPIILAAGAVGLLLFANFYKALSFGHYDPYEIEFRIARVVVAASLFFAGATWLVGKAFREWKRNSESGVIVREMSSIFFAIFFGGFFSIAHSWQAAWAFFVPAVPYLLWVMRVEFKKPQNKPRRRWWRILAWTAVPALTFAILHYIAFS